MLRFAFIIVVSCLSSARADEVDHAYVVQGLEAGRSSLLSGDYTLKWRLRLRDGMENADGDRSEEPQYFVQEHRTHVRFDHRRRIFSFQSWAQFPVEDKRLQRRQYIKGPEVIYSSSGIQSDTIGIRALSSHHRTATYPNPDVRLMGLNFIGDCRAGHTWEDIWGRVYKSKSILSAKRIRDTGQIEVHFDEPMRRVLFIDEEKGFWPVKVVSHDPDTGRVAHNTNVTLVEVDGYWVPHLVEMIDLSASAQRSLEPNTLHLEFNWKSVNQDLPDEWFHYRQFEAKPGTRVVDFRQDPGLLVETISEPQVGPLQASPSGRAVWVLVAVVTMIVVGVAVWYTRRRMV